MTQTVTVNQASIADLIEQRDALLRACRGVLGLTIARGNSRQLADLEAAIAKASPIAGLTEIGGSDEQ